MFRYEPVNRQLITLEKGMVLGVSRVHPKPKTSMKPLISHEIELQYKFMMNEGILSIDLVYGEYYLCIASE